MKKVPATYEELEFRNEVLERALSNLTHWNQVMYAHANNPSNSAEVRQAYAKMNWGMNGILAKTKRD
jgi:hypothetical protein